MQILPYKLRTMVPPKDDLRGAIYSSKLSLRDGDIVAISSKVVSIGEGRTLPIESIEKELLVKKEADWYFKAPKSSKYRRYFTITKGSMAGSAGIDESNADGHYVLYPKDPFKSAKLIRTWLMKTYGIQELGIVITDSTSIPLRRGAIGFALAWNGFDPLRDYRGTPDIFGRPFKIEVSNTVDAIAAAATLAMGEGNEQTPIAVVRDVPGISFKNRTKKQDQLIVAPDDDVFAPLFWRTGWKRGGNK